MTMDGDELERRYKELVGLADQPATLREEISELDREDFDELLMAVVMREASLEEARRLGTAGDERDPDDDESPPGDAELPADPHADPGSPYVTALQQARSLREAVVSADGLDELLNTLAALEEREFISVLFEFGLNELWKRRLDAVAEDRGDR